MFTAEVHGIESRRTSQEVYAAFYNLYAHDSHQDADGVSSTLFLSPRILHFDETDDRSQHIVVRHKDSSKLIRPSHRVFHSKTYQLYLPYDDEDFIVATTDGETIEQWNVQYATGIYEGRIHTVMYPYQPENETVHLNLMRDGEKRKLTFNLATGLGRLDIGNKQVGWILGDEESNSEYQRLTAVSETPVTLGHLAVVS